MATKLKSGQAGMTERTGHSTGNLLFSDLERILPTHKAIAALGKLWGKKRIFSMRYSEEVSPVSSWKEHCL